MTITKTDNFKFNTKFPYNFSTGKWTNYTLYLYVEKSISHSEKTQIYYLTHIKASQKRRIEGRRRSSKVKRDLRRTHSEQKRPADKRGPIEITDPAVELSRSNPRKEVATAQPSPRMVIGDIRRAPGAQTRRRAVVSARGATWRLSWTCTLGEQLRGGGSLYLRPWAARGRAPRGASGGWRGGGRRGWLGASSCCAVARPVAKATRRGGARGARRWGGGAHAHTSLRAVVAGTGAGRRHCRTPPRPATLFTLFLSPPQLKASGWHDNSSKDNLANDNSSKV